jgi:hypothetical protein
MAANNISNGSNIMKMKISAKIGVINEKSMKASSRRNK